MTIKNLEDRIKGNTSNSVEFVYWNETNDLGVDLTGASLKCQFRAGGKNGQIITELTIGSGITILDAVGGEFQIDEISPLNWSEGNYWYDIEVTFSDGDVKTYVGGVMKVVDTVTK